MLRASVLALALVAAMSAAQGAAAQPYEIPVLVSLTGPFAFLGAEEAKSLHALETYVNANGGVRGQPIHFAVSDAQSNPVVAVQLANQLLGNHGPVVMGPEVGAAVSAMTPLLKDSAVLYCFAPSIHPSAGSYVFSNMVSTRDLISAGIRYLRARGVRRLGLIASTDLTGNDQVEQVTAAAHERESAGLQIVDTEHFAISDTSVASQIARIEAAHVDAIFVGTTGTGYGTVMHAISDAGLRIPVMTNAGNIVRPQMEQLKPYLGKETLFTGVGYFGHQILRGGPIKDAQDVFERALRAEGVSNPDIGYISSWDPAMIVVSALRRFGPGMTAAQLHQYIESLHGFAGINGSMDFRDGSQRGLGINAAIVVRWDEGKDYWVPVSQPGGVPL